MPRRKIDPLDDMLQYFTNEPLVVVLVVRRLLNKIADRRVLEATPAVPKQRKKRQPKTPTAQQTMEAVTQTAPLPPAPRPPRQRRMRADSAPPANEAKPIVPLQAEVGGDDSEAYTGN
jgi:hypothetical protein